MPVFASAWHRVLQDDRSRKVIVVTLLVGGARLPRLTAHPAGQVSAICVATEFIEITEGATGRLLPFWPWLLAWPPIEYRYAPEDHRAEIPDVQVSISGGAALRDIFTGRIAIESTLCRIDLAADGITAEQLIPLLEGPISDPQWDAAGSLTFTAHDGAPQRVVQWPLGPLTPDDVPDAPAGVAGAVQRQWVIGNAPDHVRAHPIDGGSDPTTSRTFYLWENGENPPTGFFKGGERLVTDLPAVDLGRMPTGFSYTRLTFPRAVHDIRVGQDDTITVTGGSGRTSGSAILDLLDFGGYAVTPEARSLIAVLQIGNLGDLGLVLNTPESILTIVFDRLLAQTPLVPVWRQNQIHVLDQQADGAELALSIGTGLRDRSAENVTATRLDAVANVFEVRCGTDLSRTTLGDLAPLLTIRRDAESGGSVGGLLRESRRRYGPLPFHDGQGKRGVDAPDLRVFRGAEGAALSCPAGEQRADTLARIHALPHQQITYNLDWYEGMMLKDLNWRARPTDASQQLDDTATRVVVWRLPDANGPRAVFQTEDTDVS